MIISTCSQCNCIGHNVHLCPLDWKFLVKTTATTSPPTKNESSALEFLKKNCPIDIIIPNASDVDRGAAIADNPDGQHMFWWIV